MAMESVDVEKLVKQLSAGFDALQDEYQKLFGQHHILERKLATTRDQYNELARLYGAVQTATPPLSLSSSPGQLKEEASAPSGVAEMLEKRINNASREAARKVRSAVAAANELRLALPIALENTTSGVKIWSGPLADRQEASSSMMPSISESPLEQDFTVEGTPSKLGCPFASMKKKKLSSHAASVLSRYDQNGSVDARGSVGAASTPLSTASHVNGRDSFSKRRSRRASFMDPIKAEICGLSDHASRSAQSPRSEHVISNAKPATVKAVDVENAEVGVCPIRFLDQHSPEEVATYFEKHKHELPRSHEVCVMRYQSNDEQIKELDAKYGNLVSMIQGLGQTHKDYLPEEPDDIDDEVRAGDALDDAKVRKWASSVSAQAPDTDINGHQEQEDRQPHFDRPLREIRVGESPSRPWGVQVPLHMSEQPETQSDTSSKPAAIATAAVPDVSLAADKSAPPTGRPAGKCPFGRIDVTGTAPASAAANPVQQTGAALKQTASLANKPDVPTKPDPTTSRTSSHLLDDAKDKPSPRIVFNGPVFIGYSPEDAVKFLQKAGYRTTQ